VIKNLISSCESSGDIILDFFAGSGSTGQAVMEMNARDGGERKCILVQLPEKINPDSEIYQSGLKP
jgi:adenine-specific DNA-methyltransferase